jgi:hypothetical protein
MTGPIPDREPGGHSPQHYHLLAQMMSRDANLAIFRRFEDLNYTRLMSLQAEIVEVKVIYGEKCKEDYIHNPAFAKSFRSLYLSRKPRDRVPSQDIPAREDEDSELGWSRQCHRKSYRRNDSQPEQRSMWQWSQVELLDYLCHKLSEYSVHPKYSLIWKEFD